MLLGCEKGWLCARRVADQFGTAVLNDHGTEMGEPVTCVDVPRIVAIDGDVKGKVPMPKNERIDGRFSRALEVIQRIRIEVLLTKVCGQGKLAFLAASR